MTTDVLTEFAPPDPGVEELATLLSVAVTIEPELIRAVRLTLAPRWTVGVEADLWFSDWVGTRTAESIQLRAELLPVLRDRLTHRLSADRADPAWRLWDTMSAVRPDQPAALAFEEEVTWTAMCRAAGAETAGSDELLQPALRAVVHEGRSGVADWFSAAWPRLPLAVRETVTAWQLLQAAADRSDAPALADEVRLSLADVHTLGSSIADVTIRARHDGADLVLNYAGAAPAVLLPVPDTSPRIVEAVWEADGSRHTETLHVGADAALTLRVGAGPVRLRTGRGHVFRVGPPSAVAPGTPDADPRRTRRPGADETGQIVGGLPPRSPDFTGRRDHLDRIEAALRTSTRTSVLVQTLHGMGGMGKTQIAVEYAYRHLHEYDLVWWIPAEQTSTVLSEFARLAQRLGIPISEDLQETARNVLDRLTVPDLAWLLIYDNADDPRHLERYLPSAGGHVLVTSRSQEWASVGDTIEVSTLSRQESIELLRRRSRGTDGDIQITTVEADALADQLGDLPLALEQAAAWLNATLMPVREYIDLLDTRIELLNEGTPPNYPTSVSAFVTLAMEQLHRDGSATAQLMELFAFLGSEPVPIALLRRGQHADLTEPLRSLLRQPIQVNRSARDLSRLGLARMTAGQRLQVHRLVARILRDTMLPDRAAESQRNVRALLAAANPGDPDERGEFDAQAQLGPHIEPAGLVDSTDVESLQVLLDHARYLFITGDYENSRLLAERAAQAWTARDDDPRLGPNGELTLLAQARRAEALRALGDSAAAHAITRDTYDRLRSSSMLGPHHEYTLIAGIQVGHDLRISGLYQEALAFDTQGLAAFRDVFGPTDVYTLRAMASLASDYRLIGDFAEALRIDTDIADVWADQATDDWRALTAQLQVSRDLLDLGSYDGGVEVADRMLPALSAALGPLTIDVLVARRVRAALSRRTGRLEAAADALLELHVEIVTRLGPGHEHALATQVSLANALRELGDLDEAGRRIGEAVARYQADFGERHPLTLIAEVDAAVIYRAASDHDRARSLDQRSALSLTEILGADHPATLCAQTGLATDLALAGEHDAARALSAETLQRWQAVLGGEHEARNGSEHPDLLRCAVNLAQDLDATGSPEESRALLEQSVAGLRRALGSTHLDVRAAENGHRLECDIEPPST